MILLLCYPLTFHSYYILTWYSTFSLCIHQSIQSTNQYRLSIGYSLWFTLHRKTMINPTSLRNELYVNQDAKSSHWEYLLQCDLLSNAHTTSFEFFTQIIWIIIFVTNCVFIFIIRGFFCIQYSTVIPSHQFYMALNLDDMVCFLSMFHFTKTLLFRSEHPDSIPIHRVS